MPVYLHDIPLPDAKARLQAVLEEAGLWRVLGVETIQLDENALGRVLAEPVWAKVSSPHYNASAMDGFAVRALDTAGAQPSSPLLLPCSLAPSPSGSSAQYVDTGDPLPDWANAVIPIENVEVVDEKGKITSDLLAPKAIRIRAAVTPWSQVRALGEDIVATQLVLAAGQILRPVDLGAIAAAGHAEIEVARKPRVAILPTGTELVPIGSQLEPGDILEYNSLVLAAQVNFWGGEAVRLPITPDNFEAIVQRVQEAAREFDLILLNAGSSAGVEDFSAKVVAKLGTLLVHGVAIRPGHPVILGVIAKSAERSDHRERHRRATKQSPISEEIASSGKECPERSEWEPPPRNATVPIIGVPGYPVSAALTAEIFVEPLLAKWLGRRPGELPTMSATLTRKVASPGGDDDYLRVAVGKVGDKVMAAPLARGAGVITSLVRADGLVILPRGVQGAEAGEEVRVHLYRSKAEIERTIFCIGSHDMTLDLLAQFLAEHDRRLVSANVGSLGGLVALKRGESHLAGSHLLDPETGEYTLSYIHKYLSNVPINIYEFVRRDQGLIVRKGNPKRIKSLGDLTRPEVSYVNRQRGAGTRVLFDYHLNRSGIVTSLIQGYSQEEYTHLGVAAAVASGRADCGLGIPAAAQSLELDFIPLFQETYQLVIPKNYAESELLAPLFVVLNHKDFQDAVTAMPGYNIEKMGKLVSET